MRFESLSELQLDALREVGNIGAGHAATALSQLVDRPVDLSVPSIEIVPLPRVPYVFGGPERLVVAVYARMLGDLEGGILFIAARDDALSLVDLMHGRPVGETRSMGREEEALLRHVASILISSYLAAIARLAGLDVLPSSPALAFDMAGAILHEVVAEVDMTASDAALVRASFIDEVNVVEAALFFVPEPDSLNVLLGKLGLV